MISRKTLIILLCFIVNINAIAATGLNSHIITTEYKSTLNYLTNKKKLTISQNFLIIIDTKTQKLSLYNPSGVLLKSYIVSTSKKGLGQLIGSRKTPAGLHKIVEKIGHNVPPYGIFRKRQFTNTVWKKPSSNKLHKKDFIVTRILRLEGLEPGINYGKNNYGQTVDSFNRGIYIHATTMEWKLGTTSTIGCIHLNSTDMIELFNTIPIDSLVMIY
jgi:lipoprotein-anchoring transpeptidase ErfK/SrfK